MSYQVLARKWRPRTFAEVIGQGHVLKALINALKSDRLHHAYLFTGTRGVGKTTLARVFAKALNCEQGVSPEPCGECSACQEIDAGRFVDLIEVDAASRTKVDETRELLDNVQYAPTRARYKVYLIDEVHMFSNHSFNALLKTLEEPPPHVKFLLATTDPKKLPVTILSRCLQFNLTRIGPAQLSEHLARVLGAEGIEFEASALDLIAPAAAGSVRDALSLLDQAIAHGAGRVVSAEVAQMLGTVDHERITGLLEAVASGSPRPVIEHARALAEFVPDYAQVLAELLALLRRIAVAQALGDEADDIESNARVQALAAALAPDEVQLYYQIALTGRRDLELSPEPESGFEMILLRMLAFQPATHTSGGDTASPPASRPAPPSPPAATTADAPAAVTPTAPPSASADPEAAAVPAATPPRAAAGEWTALVESIAISGLVRELARNSAVASIAGTEFELVIAPQYEKLAQQRHLDALREALNTELGREVRVSVRVDAEAGVMTPSEQYAAEAAARQRDAEQEIENDPHVQAVRDTFGATVENVSARS